MLALCKKSTCVIAYVWLFRLMCVMAFPNDSVSKPFRSQLSSSHRQPTTVPVSRKIALSRAMPSCKYFNRYGECTRPNCGYKHKVKFCNKYQRGICRFGHHCKYRHSYRENGIRGHDEGSSDAGRRQQQLSESTQPVAGLSPLVPFFVSHPPVSAPHHPVSVPVSEAAPRCVCCMERKPQVRLEPCGCAVVCTQCVGVIMAIDNDEDMLAQCPHCRAAFHGVKMVTTLETHL